MRHRPWRHNTWVTLRRFLPIALVFAIATSTFAQTPRLAVMDLRPGGGISPEEARTLTGMLRTALHETGAFTLINREDMESIAQNHQIELVFCDDDACLLRVGSLLGAEKLVAGEIGLVIDEFVVNARLVDIGSKALINERVATRRSGQTALALQRAMNELAADLSGRPAPSGLPGTERTITSGVDGVIYAIDGDRVLLDSGRWEGMKNGTILEILDSRPVDPSDSSQAVNMHHGERSLGQLRVVDVFGSHSAAACLGSLKERDLQIGDQVRKFRVPSWLLVEPHVGYLYSPQTVRQEYTVVTYSSGSNPQLTSSTHNEPLIRIRGLGIGGSLTVLPLSRVQFSLFGTVEWAYTVDGSYTYTRFDYPSETTRRYGIVEQNFLEYGAAARVRLHVSRRIDWYVEPFAAAIDWMGLPSDFDPVAVIELPTGVVGLRLGLQFHASQRIGFTLSPGVRRTFGGDWSVSCATIQFAPCLSL